jgi:Fic family protein
VTVPCQPHDDRRHYRVQDAFPLAVPVGHIRAAQNWIGGSSYNPCSAAFVPPPPELVHDLLDDLCHFCNDDSLPAVAQAAMAHAQFETIHPFVDGNGRTGRALVHFVLRTRGLATRVLPPISAEAQDRLHRGAGVRRSRDEEVATYES